MPRARERLRANRQQFLAPSVPPHSCKLLYVQSQGPNPKPLRALSEGQNAWFSRTSVDPLRMAGLSRRMGARTRRCCCAPQRWGGAAGRGRVPERARRRRGGVGGVARRWAMGG